MRKLLVVLALALIVSTGCGKSEQEQEQEAVDACTSKVTDQVPNNGYQVRFDDPKGDPQATKSGSHWNVTGWYYTRGPSQMKTGSFRCEVTSPTDVTVEVTPDK